MAKGDKGNILGRLKLNKKFLLPFLLALAQMILIIVNKYYPETKQNLVLHDYTVSF